MAKAMILEKVKAKALYLDREMTLMKVKGSGLGRVVLKMMNLAKIMSSTWYEVGQEVDMKLVMIMAKISATEFFMAIDDLHDDGYRFPFSSERWLLKGHLSIFDQSKVNKNQKLNN